MRFQSDKWDFKVRSQPKMRSKVINEILKVRNEISKWEMRFQSEKWDFKVRFDVSILVRKMRNEISKWEMRYQSEKWDFKVRSQP